ncbi:hypothetical protein GBA65_01495 [Rubrobacter marinus]|uniref:Sulfotransferase n=1 Tax=Rubrobacter marinus TaxID=2653852 RepID=A0A6G8PSI8_9ACTN|nr:sulfotransferase [Rubrobacter marinus]QIN77400.1 hypothetical protein GBA65_01495 [Rubrobacter marinus]
MPFPDFLIIGAQKAGTSWLASNLSRHPDVWTPPLKEIHYFDQRAKEPPFVVSLMRLCRTGYTDEDWYPWYWRNQSKRLLRSILRRSGRKPEPGTLSWALKFLSLPPSDRWYASLFEEGGGRKTGEATPEYAILEEAEVARVHELMPDARIVFFMRNPIERLYSSALMRLRHLAEMGRETEADDRFFERFFREPEVVAETKYLRSLERWRRFYGTSRSSSGSSKTSTSTRPSAATPLLVSRVDPARALPVERRKVNAAHRETMPTPLAVHLALAYREDLQLLSARFGGYASFWLHCAEKLTSNPPDEETLPYPLWESWLWDEWKKGRGPAGPTETGKSEVQSRALAPS